MSGRLAATAIALSILVQGARADDSNFRPYAVGARAAGMGGAFTGLADDGSGPFYNPGGVAFTRRSQLSLSGSVYGVVSGTFKDALGDGHDFSYRNLNVFPTATSAVWKLGAPEAASANVVAVSVFVPDAFNADDRDTLGSKENAFFLSNQVQTVWMGLTYARRMGPVGVGATGFFLLGTRLQQLDLTLAPTGQFGTVSSRIDESTQGFVGALGIRWDVTRWLYLGASVYSPAVGWGSRRVFVRGLAAPTGGEPQIAIENEDHLHASPSEPLRAQAGLAFTLGRLTLSADAIFLAGRDLTDDAGALFERRVVRKPVTNFAAGVEYVLVDRFPLRAGLFTDFAASRSPPDSSVENTSHIDRYGGTFSVGYRSEHTSTDLGLNVSGGSGQDLVPRNLDFSNLQATGSSQLLLYVFLATSYEF